MKLGELSLLCAERLTYLIRRLKDDLKFECVLESVQKQEQPPKR